MADKRKISLVVADVDGTLVDEHKVLTQRAQAAVLQLHEAGIRFAVTSGRPPAGMAMLLEPLRIDTPDRRVQWRSFPQAGPLDPRTEDGAARYRRRRDRSAAP